MDHVRYIEDPSSHISGKGSCYLKRRKYGIDHYNTRKKGTEYEDVAASYLSASGYRILERNYRISSGEIDLIASKDRYLIFVEVKYRSNGRHGSPEAAVTSVKQRQISKVAVYYMKRYGYDPYSTPVRFDVVAVSEGEVHHIKDAFPYQGYY